MTDRVSQLRDKNLRNEPPNQIRLQKLSVLTSESG
jgi:hypothetical protein